MRRFRLEHADAQARDWLRRVFIDEARGLGTRVAEEEGGRFVLHWD
jgi:hypothetical protein